MVHKNGDIVTLKNGKKIKILDYKTWKDITIIFLDETNYITKTNSLNIRGYIKNPYIPTISNIGYFGEGEYKAKIEGKMTRVYMVWTHIFERCYNENVRYKYPTYKNTTICEEWHNFQNFAKWYSENYIEGYFLDKDLKQMNSENKIYSPDTCVFISRKINNFIATDYSNNTSGSVGVQNYKNGTSFRASSRYFENGKQKHIGSYATEEEASNAYSNFRKEQCEIAKQYMRDLGYYSEEIIQLIK